MNVSMSTETPITGDCFGAALRIATDLIVGGHRPLVCHGHPIGTSGPVEGIRYWHAWVEYRHPEAGWLVIDGASKKRIEPLVVHRTDYYRVGQIDPGEVRRYSPGQVLDCLNRYEHGGPWVSDEERDATP